MAKPIEWGSYSQVFAFFGKLPAFSYEANDRSLVCAKVFSLPKC